MSHLLVGDTEKGLRLIEISNAIIQEAKRTDFAEKVKQPTRSQGYVDSR